MYTWSQTRVGLNPPYMDALREKKNLHEKLKLGGGLSDTGAGIAMPRCFSSSHRRQLRLDEQNRLNFSLFQFCGRNPFGKDIHTLSVREF